MPGAGKRVNGEPGTGSVYHVTSGLTPAPSPRADRPSWTPEEGPVGTRLDSALAVLNGLIGDYLESTDNGLATPMELVHDGAAVPLDPSALALALPEPTARVVLLVHGAMCTESVWSPRDDADPDQREDYGALLARDLGYTPLYLRYNTGCAIPDNGAALADTLERLVASYPVELEEILLVAHSMGGLVARSACQVAHSEGQLWLRLVRRAIYLGTPHLGAPLERWGRALARLLHAVDDPYTRLLAQIGDLRSDGVKDLGDADLRHEDRARFLPGVRPRNRRHPVPLLPGIRHYLVAATLSSDPRLAATVGDVLVPVPSATAGLGSAPAPAPSHVKVLPGVGHLRLARHPEVYAQIRSWLEEAP